MRRGIDSIIIMTLEEDIERLKASLQSRDDLISLLISELEKKDKSPWISVDDHFPEEDKKEDGSRKYYSKTVLTRCQLPTTKVVGLPNDPSR